ncbi:MAG: helix-turn-helix transcriptional regulator [Fimbriimonadaceae bacterium]|nr:helix-turn-helix transcriptional regulator [Fimbriimonadaceae bacterium]QYK55434.1 MAG: helix-turn-helix transcriptional regulator [Fimbriimonadaceae bacterium]
MTPTPRGPIREVHATFAPGFDLDPQAGEILRCIRLRRGLSISEAARRVGMSPSLLSAYERGLRWPEPARLAGIAVTMGADRKEGSALARREVPDMDLRIPDGVEDGWVWLRTSGLWDGRAWSDLDTLRLRRAVASLALRPAVARRMLGVCLLVYASSLVLRGHDVFSSRVALQAYNVLSPLGADCPERWRALALCCLANVFHDPLDGARKTRAMVNAIERWPTDGAYRPLLHLLLADAHSRLGEMDACHRHFEQAEQTVTDKEVAYYVEIGRIRHAFLRGDFEQAAAVADAVQATMAIDEAARLEISARLHDLMGKRLEASERRARALAVCQGLGCRLVHQTALRLAQTALAP